MVKSASFGEPGHVIFNFPAGTGLNTEFPCQFYPGSGNVHAHHPAAGCFGNLDLHQAEQTQSDHQNGIIQLRRSQTEPVNCHRTEGRKSGLLKADLIRKLHEQIPRNNFILRMDGMISSAAGDTVPDPEPLHAIAQSDDRPRGRITGKHGLVQTVESGLDTAQNAFPFGFVKHLLHQIRAGYSLGGKVFLRKFNQSSFCAGRNKRICGLDQGTALSRMWDRQILDRGFTVFHILEELFHRLLSFPSIHIIYIVSGISPVRFISRKPAASFNYIPLVSLHPVSRTQLIIKPF